MKQHGVSIVLCSNCGHGHPQGVCLEVVHGGHGDRYLPTPQVNDICGCHDYQPVLKPFAGVPSKPNPALREGNNPWLVALAFLLLLGMIAYAQWGVK